MTTFAPFTKKPHAVCEGDRAEADGIGDRMDERAVRVEQLHGERVKIGEFRRPKLRSRQTRGENHIRRAHGDGITEHAAERLTLLESVTKAATVQALDAYASQKRADGDLAVSQRIRCHRNRYYADGLASR